MEVRYNARKTLRFTRNISASEDEKAYSVCGIPRSTEKDTASANNIIPQRRQSIWRSFELDARGFLQLTVDLAAMDLKS